ncbi:ABC transporter permease subunit [Terrarubrum flagellatum]|uniref:amino acid ABC transporter permease n=1 Tax=Terrirubrum flagellatum TaxID=2895980 RepID=UPI00314553EE
MAVIEATLEASAQRSDAKRRTPYRRQTAAAVLAQAAALFCVASAIAYFAHNVSLNLKARGLVSGFDFLWREAGFGIGFSVIPFSETDSYARALLVGLTNTLLVAGVALILATLLGVVIGVARVARHAPTAAAARAYVELLRNIPLLVLVLFSHQLLINRLPPVRESLSLGDWIYLNNRGLVLPSMASGNLAVPFILFLAVIATCAALLATWMHRNLAISTRRTVAISLCAFLAAELFVAVFALDWRKPTLAGFNFRDGLTLVPEFVALASALIIYNAAFIAEIVRAGIESVSRGQREAAAALGLPSGLLMRLIILPQALRVIIPPLANQYSHLLKASSLATVIGYPDLVNVFLGTSLNQTGRAIEIVTITMAIYLALGGAIAAFTSWFNRRMALVER